MATNRERVIEECKAAIAAAFLKGFGGVKAETFQVPLSDITCDSYDALQQHEIISVLDHLKTNPIDTKKETTCSDRSSAKP